MRRHDALAAALILCLIPALALAQPAQRSLAYKSKEESLPKSVAPQPVPFSHRRHLSTGAKCVNCHPTAEKGERAGLPDAAHCMHCHEAVKADSPAILELARKHRAKEKIAWFRVYEVPGYVFFSHASHTRGEVLCGTCHGPVRERNVLAKEVSTSMTACMNCHAARKVSNECHFCHILGH